MLPHFKSTWTSSHLYYQASSVKEFVDRAEGIYIWDENGKRYIDGCSGAIICNLGHGDKRVLKAMQDQAEQVCFTYRTQFENRPGHELAGLLAELSAEHLDQVFYVSGGSEAVEAALKLCRQYHFSKGESRHLFISRSPSYHGSTMGALALTGYEPLATPFRGIMQLNPKIPAPYCYRCEYNATYPECELLCATMLETSIIGHGAENIAAFVVEPVSGASVGALPPPPDYFDVIQKICKKYDIMLILDEVMTGFCRTGRFFAYEHWDIEADIVALSKGLASGYMPLGATIARKEIVDQVLDSGGFQHGHTYAGNPLACAVGLAVVKAMIEDDLCGHVQKLEPLFKAKLDALAEKHDCIGQVRGKGFLWALELVMDRESRDPFPPELNAGVKLTRDAYERGLLIYPRRCMSGLMGDHVLVAPPLIITEEQLEEMFDLLDQSLAAVAEQLRESVA
jgi:adenosylmethionine-8-amino-7-oxononanoate aminotransferase